MPNLFALVGAVALLFRPYTLRVAAELSAFSRERRGARTASTAAEDRVLAPRK
ncbi:MAG: hypothetical protein VYC96_07460 [Actinomycetota bacterium]|nr:hypothetical protein [Actinomycetota bacterium]